MHTALDFYRRGIDVLHPAMSWLGGHGTIVLNFPLSEAITALLYRAFGPNLVWDRLVSLGFCIVAALYMHGIARRLLPSGAAKLATLAFLAIPLGQYYSRVPHIEFAVIAFANGFVYHALRALLERRSDQAVWAAATGILAGLIKGPYLAPSMFPLALLLFALPSAGAFLRTAAALAAIAAAFLVWRHHADAVNARVPDWSFLPDFYKEVNPLWRWMGTMAERQDPENWITLAKRLVYHVLTPVGLLFAIAASFYGGRDTAAATRGEAPRLPVDVRWILLLWWLGLAVHVLAFFRLNVLHDYYQMPFLTPAALTLGYGAHALWRIGNRAGSIAGVIAFTAFLLVATIWMPRRLSFDEIDWVRIEAGKRIQQIVPQGDLMIATDFSTLPPTDPRLLVPSDRWGWPMRAQEITPERLATLEALGARWVVALETEGRAPLDLPAHLEPYHVAVEPVMHAGRRLGTLQVFRLGAADSAAAP